MGIPDESVQFPDDARRVLGRFAESTRHALVSDGWEAEPEGSVTDDSIFLGTFQQAVTADFIATVRLILQRGPVARSVEWELRAPYGVVARRHLRASVGGELGVRHLPTERLLAELALRVSPSADVSLDLAEIFEAHGVELPVFTDEPSAEVAARVVVDAVAAHALPFARAHADVERMLEFVKDGRQTTRSETFEYMFVAALLAASGRPAEALVALAEYQQQVPRVWQPMYSEFRDRLTGWLR